MLGESTIITSIPVADLKHAKAFYVDKLGLHIQLADVQQKILIMRAGSTMLELQQHEAVSATGQTCAIFMLGDNFSAVVDDLLAKGIVFHKKELPNLPIVWDARGVATFGDRKTAWFNDPDGNVLQLYTRETLK